MGKTVLMRQILERFSGKTMLLNGEDYDAQVLLEEKSIANYRRLLADVDLLAIDEAQAIPHIGEKLKLMVDEVPGIRILATGSSAFDIRNQVGEPLVGRGSSFILQPFHNRKSRNRRTCFKPAAISKHGLSSEVILMWCWKTTGRLMWNI